MHDPRRDDAPDPHLRAALRHAPDRDIEPPPNLSERIRREAHAAVKLSPPDGHAGWLPSLFDRMTRPAWAGALGTVAIAGVIGLLWRDGVPPEPAPVEAPPAASREAKSESPPAAAERAAEPPVAAPLVQRKAAPAPPPPAPPPPVAAADESRAGPRAGITAERARQAAPAARMPAAPAAAADPLAAPLAALADGPADVRERLLALQRRHAGKWQSVEPLAPDQGEVVTDAAGRILGRLLIDERAVTWQPPSGRAWRAPR